MSLSGRPLPTVLADCSRKGLQAVVVEVEEGGIRG